jgi:hypothetical protein
VDAGLVGWVMVGIFVVMLLFILGLGIFYPGSGARQLDWRPTRSPEVEAQNEIDDIDQMLEAANERRRRRGEPELTEESLGDRVRADRQELGRRREAYKAEQEIRDLLAARNERRRARGLPEMTLEEFEESLKEPWK